MMWFRTVLTRLSRAWLRPGSRRVDRERDRARPRREIGPADRASPANSRYEQLQEIGSKTMLPDWIRPDVDLLITVGRFWGADAVKRFRFDKAPERHEPSMMETLLDRFRG